uniref:Wound-induced protein 1 n=4 Tax=Setaria TaxID=4554 RepID=K4A2G1_SETIT
APPCLPSNLPRRLGLLAQQDTKTIQSRALGSKELAASAKLEEEPRVLGATAAGESEEQRNKFLVLRLYEALNGRDHAGVQALLAADLEWWFHGPPKHQHMMRVLTGGGSNSSSSFRFAPRSVDAFGSTVIAEGGDQERGVYWVHAWTVGADGVITQLREYFNTDLTVTRLAAATKCIWQSRRPDRATNSLPGLVLAL